MNVYEAHKKLAHTLLVTFDMVNNPNIELPRDQHGPAIYLVGIVYNKTGFKDGTEVKTSTIKEIKDGVAIAYSGSEYELGEMHPHYKIFCERIAENKPVLFNFCIGKVRAFNNPDFKKYERNNSVYMSGNVFINGKVEFAFAEVDYVDTKNFTVKTVDGTEYWVVLSSWHFATRACSHESCNIFVPTSIENHHYLKKYETKIEECFLNDIHFGDIKDIIGTTHSGKKEYMPIFHYWITHQKENILLAPTSDNIEK